MLNGRCRSRIEQKVAAGALRHRHDGSLFGGRSSGANVCAGCDGPIAAGEMEIELLEEGEQRHWYFHVACHDYLAHLPESTSLRAD